MNATEVAILIAAIVGVVTIVGVTLQFVGYFGSHPKRSVQYRVHVTPVMQSVGSYGDRIRLLFDEEELDNPHLVEVAVIATGRVDIRRDDFDGDQPLVFDLGSDVRSLGTEPENTAFCFGDRQLLFPPNLMPHKKEGAFVTTFLCDGKPEVKLVEPHPLADTEVTAAQETNNQELWRASASLIGWSVYPLAALIFPFPLVLEALRIARRR